MMENPLAGLAVPEGWTTHTEIREDGQFLHYVGRVQSPEGEAYSVTVTRPRGDVVYYDDEERWDADTWQQVKMRLAQRAIAAYGDPERPLGEYQPAEAGR